MIPELQSAAAQTLALTKSILDTGVVSCDAGPARLFQVIPTMARPIEGSAACEQLSLIPNREALAEIYRVYRAASRLLSSTKSHETGWSILGSSNRGERPEKGLLVRYDTRIQRWGFVGYTNKNPPTPSKSPSDP